MLGNRKKEKLFIWEGKERESRIWGNLSTKYIIKKSKISSTFRNLACLIDTTTKSFGLIESYNERNLFGRFLAGLWQLKAVSPSFLPTLCALAPPTTTEMHNRRLWFFFFFAAFLTWLSSVYSRNGIKITRWKQEEFLFVLWTESLYSVPFDARADPSWAWIISWFGSLACSAASLPLASCFVQ